MIYREINGVQLAINPNSANELFFEKGFLHNNSITNREFTPTDICKIIADEKFIPLILTWELLDKCNFSCPFCYIVGHSKHKVIRFEKTKKYIDKIIDLGLLYCQLTGGEALLHKDFNEIYKYLKEKGVLVELYSNGHLITEKHIELFEEYPPYRIEISIYGTNQEEFDITTGTKNNDFQATLDNIILLKKKGINVRCKSPINNITKKNFNAIQKWCKDNSVEFYYSTKIYNAHDGTDLTNYQTTIDEVVYYETKKVIQVENDYPGTTNIFENKGVKNCYTCGVRNYGFHINANFDLLPCSETHIDDCTYSILERGFSEALTLNRKFVNKHMDKPIKGCIGCEASSICKMCPAIAKPVINELNEVQYFELPKGHCDFERKKYNGITTKLLE